MSKCVYCLPQTKRPVYTDANTETTVSSTTKLSMTTGKLLTTTMSGELLTTNRKHVIPMRPSVSTSQKTMTTGYPAQPDPTPIVIAVSLAVTVVLLLLFVGVLIFMIKRRKRHPRDNTSDLKMENPRETKVHEEYDDVIVTNKASEHESQYEYAYEKIVKPTVYSPLGRKDSPNIYEDLQQPKPSPTTPAPTTPKEVEKNSKDNLYVLPEARQEGPNIEQELFDEVKKHSQLSVSSQGSYLVPVVLKGQPDEKQYGAAYVKVLP